MAEDKNGFVSEIKRIVNAEMKFSEKYKIQYLEREAFESIQNILSEMRRSKILSGDQYHLLFDNYRQFYKNGKKYKNLLASEPRYIAQKFIGQKEIRKLIFNRDKKCLCCGSEDFLTIDHIVPVKKNGLNELENLQTLCRSCNSRKSDRTIDYRKNTAV